MALVGEDADTGPEVGPDDDRGALGVVDAVHAVRVLAGELVVVADARGRLDEALDRARLLAVLREELLEVDGEQLREDDDVDEEDEELSSS